jgi:hypothetical protein
LPFWAACRKIKAGSYEGPILLWVLYITLPPAAQVSDQIDLQAGVNGRLQLAMSTSFQLAPWSYQFFTLDPNAVAPLGALYPFHTRVQVINTGIPLTAPDTWLHRTQRHVRADPIHRRPFLPASFPDLAQMSAGLVRYYNTGGFTDAGNSLQGPNPYPVTWWGIFNEPNGNGLTPQQYLDLYNTAVPAMAQADPSIRFLAVELSDYGTQAETYLPVFVAGVTAPVDVLATHFYSTCNQSDPDAEVFGTVPGFVSEVQDIYSQLAGSPKLGGVPVWVTENNVNADYALSDGMSACNPGQTYVTDLRGTSPFFAAWRALVFASLGETGAQADAQYGEVNSAASPYLSYWVDYYLSHWLPSPPGQDILQVTASGRCLWTYNGGNPLGLDTHTLAARNPDGSVVILMSNHAIDNASDNNGTGAVRDLMLDLSALGTFTSATLVQLDASTPLTGPVPVAPGEIVALFGTALGPASPADLALTNPKLVANSLAGIHVLFDGVPAPVLYGSAGQVNVVVPYAVAGESTT